MSTRRELVHGRGKHRRVGESYLRLLSGSSCAALQRCNVPRMIRDAIALAEVLRTAGHPQGEYAVVTASAQRADAAARLKSEGYLEIREETAGGKQLAVRLTAIGLALRNRLQRSMLLGGSDSPEHPA
jgi:hypothetical protein